MNVTELVAKAATHAGWHHHLADLGSRLSGHYVKGDQMLCIRYKLFGAPINYMCRFYGKDPSSGINWGIESAHIKGRVNGPPTEIWVTTKVFEGKDKKRQVLRYLRDSAEGDVGE